MAAGSGATSGGGHAANLMFMLELLNGDVNFHGRTSLPTYVSMKLLWLSFYEIYSRLFFVLL